MAYKKSEDSDMGVVKAQAQYGSPRKDNHSGNEASVDQVPVDWHSLDQRVGVGSRSIVERKHAMEGFDKELHVEVGQLQNEQTDVVWRVGTAPESRKGSSDARLL
jgi:hypothetical protein